MAKDKESRALDSLNRIADTAAPEVGPVHLVEDQDTGDRLLIYATDAGVNVELRYDNDALWMTQNQMAELFGRDRSVISRHIVNIFEEGELPEENNVQKMHIIGSGRPGSIYSLNTVISVGYRVSSKQATLFRMWATEKLVQFATKGFVVDAARLKDPNKPDHFRELLEIIRDIRASEANVYKEVRRICALCSDYAASSEKQKITFFATIQNKLHYVVTGNTGAEIRLQRANADHPNMGLTSWSGSQITKADTTTAKNYLGNEELRDLNRFTNMLLDYFEQESELGRLVLMSDAENELDRFIKMNRRPLLIGKGRVSKKDADRHTEAEYARFKEIQRKLAHEQSNEDD